MPNVLSQMPLWMTGKTRNMFHALFCFAMPLDWAVLISDEATAFRCSGHFLLWTVAAFSLYRSQLTSLPSATSMGTSHSMKEMLLSITPYK